MAVKLRLRRMGKKKQPVYKVVVADVRSPRDGRFIEAIGFYNPQTDPATIDIKEDRANYWLDVGAQPTDTVKNLFSKKGIILQRELKKQELPEDKIAAKMEEWTKMREAKLVSSVKKKTSKKSQGGIKKEEQKEDAKPAEPQAVNSEPEVKGTTSEETQAEEKKD
ncbi:MAG: 30S ribosomal protein S16 [Ignavibacteria bacterium RBG_13_36_8]|nr:MAG: 30S ribosomal protein S16 [Ignavibacteria bacterium RBG_13_36_8]